MKRFWKNVCRGYMMIVEPVNECWSYLFIFDWWRQSFRYVLCELILTVILVLITPGAYICVGPIVAVIEGMKGVGK